MSVLGNVALVTGGSRGIGKAIVLELVSNRVKVAFTYQANRAAADALYKEVQERGGEIIGFQQDVTNFEGVKAVFAAVHDRFGHLDMLVNNAGITRDKPLAMMQETDWQTVIETNLYGTINFSRAAVYAFMKQRSGRIVNITSVSGCEIGHHGQRGLPRIHHHGYAGGNARATPRSAAYHHSHGAFWPAQRGCQSSEISSVRGRLLHHRTSVHHRRWPIYVVGLMASFGDEQARSLCQLSHAITLFPLSAHRRLRAQQPSAHAKAALRV
jgi:NAD(P)-dependent dehydrogenase (short-subunit alcohol dehydrogenase family)